MNMKTLAWPLLSVAALAASPASAVAVLGTDLQSLAMLSNTYVTTGATTTIFGSLMAGDVGTTGAGGHVSGDFTTVGADHRGRRIVRRRQHHCRRRLDHG